MKYVTLVSYFSLYLCMSVRARFSFLFFIFCYEYPVLKFLAVFKELTHTVGHPFVRYLNASGLIHIGSCVFCVH